MDVAVTQETTIDAARALVPLIHKERADGEAQAQLTSKVISACGRAGLFRMTAPREVGGLESSIAEVIAVTEMVSAADPAVGWYIQNCVPVSRVVAFLGEAEREAVFANPNVNFGNGGQNQGKAIPDGDGYKLTGRWPVVTGVASSEWSGLIGTVMEGDAPRMIGGNPDIRTFVVPTKALDISNTWQDVTAMRGTGSNMVVAQDVHVEEAFTHSAVSSLVIDRPYFWTPPVFLALPPVAATVIGVLSTAIETVTEALKGHTASVTGIARRDQTASQELIAHCRFTYRSLRAGLFDVAGIIDDAAAQGERLTDAQRAEVYATCMLICEEGAALASRIYTGGTRDAFLKDNPVERALKDLHAIGYVMASFRHLVHSSGRVMLGGEHDPGL